MDGNRAGEQVDLFVIGGGSGGVRAARMAAARGARVALAEMAEFGGTCVNVGCIPKKLYSYAAGYGEAFEEATGFGWQLDSPPRLDWGKLKAARAGEIHRLNSIYQQLLEGPGVTILRERACLLDAHTVQAGGRHWRAKNILIATGGRPFVPKMPGQEHAVVSDDMFDIDPLPKRLVIVGGGYIACEMASIFNGLGSQVTLLQRGAHLLNAFDEDIRSFVAAEMGKAGIDIRLNTQISAIRRDGGECRLMLDRGQDLRADAVLMATGRAPNSEDLGLELAGVKQDDKGAVVVDAQFRTSVPHIFAVGDVSTRLQLTPVALAEAMVVVDALFPEPGRAPREAPDYDFVPTAVFTHPSIGTCGFTEAQARARFGADNITVFCTEFKPLRHTLSGRGERCFMKLLVAKDTDRVVGLHMVGAEAGEIVQGFAVAMQAGATKAHFDRTIGIHPTTAEEFVTMRVPNMG
ncbi:glutathione-disulfide reductase [Variovorax dokdonensis]|uniref:Glutathione-disulfide reductase n=1 Tax=Variovorax dokdonensis TaxID=344883 RepID=A0ABT7NB23_9BURK|nr:glutathione-disulfide reductase [Variovorax dokdonensis]MDM0045132.1 glutathione-disulfide reductase [Variovorax dokdonensis]